MARNDLIYSVTHIKLIMAVFIMPLFEKLHTEFHSHSTREILDDDER